MALDNDQKGEIDSLVRSSLDQAEAIWEAHGSELLESFAWMAADSMRVAKAESMPSKIPKHTNVSSDRVEVDDFIALVADIRNSSQHLLCDISGTKQGVTTLKRVYFETSALLPALEKTVQYNEGSVTEYLGDGILAFFNVDDENRDEVVKESYRSAKNCIGDTRSIVNANLKFRYNLPDLDIGVGLGYSKAIVQLVGIPGSRHPKAIGRCVYNATKLSSGVNKIFVDEALKNIWPSSKRGKVSFSPKVIRGVNGYLASSE